MTDPRKEQQRILQQIGGISRMRRGRLSQQYNRRKKADGTEQRWGPYYTLQAWIAGRNRSQRIPAAEVQQVREDLAHYQTFRDLCERYVELGERIAHAEDADSKKKPRPFRLPSVGKSRSS